MPKRTHARLRSRSRQPRALTIVELAAGIALGFPMIMLMIYAVLEANYLFTIRANLDDAQRRAAQALINDYLKNSSAQTQSKSPSALPSGLAFDIYAPDGTHKFVDSTASQFTWTWDFTTRPYTVTVTVSYPTSGGTSSMPAFPYPDPLKLKNRFTIMTTGTFAVPS